MTNKSTKKALLLSVLSMLLCVAMLVGTTFAWFTDSVTSGKNTIVAGNLDVELEYSKTPDVEASWKTVEGATDLLDPNALWEPGHAEVVYLRVRNLGTLALKYQFSMNIFKEIGGTNVEGESFKLSEHLMYGVADYTAKYADRDAAIAAVKDDAVALSAYSKAGDLLATKNNVADVDTIALVVYMPTTIGNEANYRGETVPSIELGVELKATQFVAEEDFFGNDYDKDAVYADHFVDTAAGLQNAIDNAKDGETIALTGNIDLSALMASTFSLRATAQDPELTINSGKSLVIDLAGYTLSSTSKNTGSNYAMFTVKGELTVKNGTVVTKHEGENMAWNNLTAPFSVEGGVLNLGENVKVVNLGGSDMSYAVDVNTTLGESVLNIDGATLYSSYIGVRIFNNHKTQKGIVNYNSGIVQGAKKGYDIWAQLMSCPAENAVVNFADGITYTTENLSGMMYYVESDTTVVANAAELTDAFVNGGNYVLVNDIDMGSTTLVVKNDTVLDLAGKTVSGTCNAGQAHLVYVNYGKQFDVKDSVGGGKLTYAQGTSNVGWTVDVEGVMNLYSGTVELTGSWSIGYAIDVRPNAWGTEYTEPTVLNMYGGSIVSSDGAVRVASSSSDNYQKVSACFNMYDGEIVADWDGVFVQQSNGAWDTLTVNLDGGKVSSALSPIRIYGPAPTSVNSGAEKPITITVGDCELVLTTELNTTKVWHTEGKIMVAGGMTLDTVNQYATVTIK